MSFFVLTIGGLKTCADYLPLGHVQRSNLVQTKDATGATVRIRAHLCA